MENKGTCVLSVALNTAGILLLAAAAFDILPISDNQAIFFAIACFVIGAAAKKIIKGGAGCCK
jgi:hypothetical protein